MMTYRQLSLVQRVCGYSTGAVTIRSAVYSLSSAQRFLLFAVQAGQTHATVNGNLFGNQKKSASNWVKVVLPLV